MGVSRVDFGDKTVIDISDSTVSEETLKRGFTAYNAAGNKIEGTYDGTPIQDVEVTALSTNWIGSDDGYTNTISIDGLSNSDRVLLDLKISDSLDERESVEEEYSLIFMSLVRDGSIMLYADDIPDMDIPLKMLIFKA